MKSLLKRLLKVLPLLLFMSAQAALKVGEPAPDFSAQASFGGKVFQFQLSAALGQGPVVLYFYPAAFTPGCTVEAHLFAEAIEQYRTLGATVIGVSNDTIETLNRFSVSECRGKFAVAADTGKNIMKAYDAALGFMTPYANRTSYVIAPDGKIIYAYTDMSPDQHVANTLAALRQWASKSR